jgi:AraC-like DNA-binding protein
MSRSTKNCETCSCTSARDRQQRSIRAPSAGWQDVQEDQMDPNMISRKPAILAAKLKCIIFQSLGVETPTLPSTAARLGVSARSLQRQLEICAITYSNLVDEVRFELARSLLANTNYVVADIGATLRYRDASSFSRAFVRWSGMSPRDYRTRYSAMPLSQLV